MTEAEIIQLLLPVLIWYSVICTLCSWLVKFIPTPEDAEKILLLKHTPLWYTSLYNLLRWASVNRAWKAERKNANGKPEPKNP